LRKEGLHQAQHVLLELERYQLGDILSELLSLGDEGGEGRKDQKLHNRTAATQALQRKQRGGTNSNAVSSHPYLGAEDTDVPNMRDKEQKPLPMRGTKLHENINREDESKENTQLHPPTSIEQAFSKLDSSHSVRDRNDRPQMDAENNSGSKEHLHKDARQVQLQMVASSSGGIKALMSLHRDDDTSSITSFDEMIKNADPAPELRWYPDREVMERSSLPAGPIPSEGINKASQLHRSSPIVYTPTKVPSKRTLCVITS